MTDTHWNIVATILAAVLLCLMAYAMVRLFIFRRRLCSLEKTVVELREKVDRRK